MRTRWRVAVGVCLVLGVASAGRALDDPVEAPRLESAYLLADAASTKLEFRRPFRFMSLLEDEAAAGASTDGEKNKWWGLNRSLDEDGLSDRAVGSWTHARTEANGTTPASDKKSYAVDGALWLSREDVLPKGLGGDLFIGTEVHTNSASRDTDMYGSEIRLDFAFHFTGERKGRKALRDTIIRTNDLKVDDADTLTEQYFSAARVEGRVEQKRVEAPADDRFALLTSVTARHEYAPSDRVSKLGLNLSLAPQYPGAGLGEYQPLFTVLETRELAFKWRPSVDVEAGNVLHDGREDSIDPAEQAARERGAHYARAHGSLRLDVRLFSPRLVATAEVNVWRLSDAAKKSHRFESYRLEYSIKSDISLGVEYRSGSRAPTFEEGRAVLLTFGLKF